MAGFPAGWLPATWELQALPMVRAHGLDVADPEGQFLVGSCTRWEELLALGEFVESGPGVVGDEVLDRTEISRPAWVKLRSDSWPSSSPIAWRSPSRPKSNSRTPVRRARTVFISV